MTTTIKDRTKNAVIAVLLLYAVLATIRNSSCMIPASVTTSTSSESSTTSTTKTNRPLTILEKIEIHPIWSRRMWNRSSVLVFEHDFQCTWAEFKPYHPPTEPAQVGGETQEANTAVAEEEERAKMCVYERQDDRFVSGSIMGRGRWRDCDALTELWNRYHDQPPDNPEEDGGRFYVEIGGNIGSCIMQMLFTTNATIVAFEPHPMNLQVLTSTLMGLTEALRNRIILFPFALGSESVQSTIIAAKNNKGNSIVGGAIIKDAESQQFYDPVQILVEPLDSIFYAEDQGRNTVSNFTIPLMKIDAQGFECNIADGAKRTLKRVLSVHAEVDETFLTGQNCSSATYVGKLGQAGLQRKGRGTFVHVRADAGSDPTVASRETMNF